MRSCERRAHHGVCGRLADALDRNEYVLTWGLSGSDGRRLEPFDKLRTALVRLSRRDRPGFGDLRLHARAGHIITSDHPTGAAPDESRKINTEVFGQLAYRRLGKYRATGRSSRRCRFTGPWQWGAGWRVTVSVQWLAVVSASRNGRLNRKGVGDLLVRLHRPLAADAPLTSLRRPGTRTVTDQVRDLSLFAVPAARRRLCVADTIVDGDDRPTDIDSVALVHQQLGDRAGVRTRQLDQRLTCLDLDENVVDLDLITYRNAPGDNVCLDQPLAWIRQPKRLQPHPSLP